MILDRVTVTGADDSVKPGQLFELSAEFPFVEWGILVSGKQQGGSRFPSEEWLDSLRIVVSGICDDDFRLSLHICGRWVRDICEGSFTIIHEMPSGFQLWRYWQDRRQRIQLNFHAYQHLIQERAFVAGLKNHCGGQQVIFQCDGVNDHLASCAYDEGIDAAPLYDRSGGAGVLPGEWPKPMAGIYSGFAGGLSPDNVAHELGRIAAVCREDDRIWIDVETHVRSDMDRQFDLGRVRAFLQASQPFVNSNVRSQEFIPVSGTFKLNLRSSGQHNQGREQA